MSDGRVRVAGFALLESPPDSTASPLVRCGRNSSAMCSSGIKKKLVVAMALVPRAEALLLDEPLKQSLSTIQCRLVPRWTECGFLNGASMFGSRLVGRRRPGLPRSERPLVRRSAPPLEPEGPAAETSF